MNEQDLIKWHNKRIETRNKLVDQHNKATRWAFLIAFVLLGILLTLIEML